jgi:hypothetical protein
MSGLIKHMRAKKTTRRLIEYRPPTKETLQRFSVEVCGAINRNFGYEIHPDFAADLANFLHVAGKIQAKHLNERTKRGVMRNNLERM